MNAFYIVHFENYFIFLIAKNFRRFEAFWMDKITQLKIND
jgi:hypothetical protein